MSTKPILFNTEMVRAILAGRKTVTRRIIKPQPNENAVMRYVFAGGRKGDIGKWHDWQQSVDEAPRWTPPYHADDILYVRETWTQLYYVDPNGYTHWDQPMYYYAADGTPDITLVDGDGFEEDDQRIRWKPSIHMPKEMARIFLRVTDVRVERLQDINEEQAKAEGIWKVEEWPDTGRYTYTAKYLFGRVWSTARECFMWLWTSTIKSADMPKYGWDANPWVWVIEFEKISKEEAMKC